MFGVLASVSYVYIIHICVTKYYRCILYVCVYVHIHMYACKSYLCMYAMHPFLHGAPCKAPQATCVPCVSSSPKNAANLHGAG